MSAIEFHTINSGLFLFYRGCNGQEILESVSGHLGKNYAFDKIEDRMKSNPMLY